MKNIADVALKSGSFVLPGIFIFYQQEDRFRGPFYLCGWFSRPTCSWKDRESGKLLVGKSFPS